MRKNQALVIAGGAFLLFCLCVLLFSIIVTLPPENPLRQVTVTAFWIGGFCLLPLLAGSALVWTLVDLRRGRQAAGRLAESVGLSLLHGEGNPLRIWYGGAFQGRPFAMKPVPFGATSYDGAHHRRSFSVKIYLRLVLAVNLRHPLAVTAVRTHRDRGEAETLAAAFPRLENGAALSVRAQRALLAFVQNGSRNLQLIDRAATPPDLLPPPLMPDAVVLLIHDLPRPGKVTPEELQAVLAEMTALAMALEEA
jgi:hypothetical protein